MASSGDGLPSLPLPTGAEQGDSAFPANAQPRFDGLPGPCGANTSRCLFPLPTMASDPASGVVVRLLRSHGFGAPESAAEHECEGRRGVVCASGEQRGYFASVEGASRGESRTPNVRDGREALVVLGRHDAQQPSLLGCLPQGAEVLVRRGGAVALSQPRPQCGYVLVPQFVPRAFGLVVEAEHRCRQPERRRHGVATAAFRQRRQVDGCAGFRAFGGESATTDGRARLPRLCSIWNFVPVRSFAAATQSVEGFGFACSHLQAFGFGVLDAAVVVGRQGFDNGHSSTRNTRACAVTPAYL